MLADVAHRHLSRSILAAQTHLPVKSDDDVLHTLRDCGALDPIQMQRIIEPASDVGCQVPIRFDSIYEREDVSRRFSTAS